MVYLDYRPSKATFKQYLILSFRDLYLRRRKLKVKLQNVFQNIPMKSLMMYSEVLWLILLYETYSYFEENIALSSSSLLTSYMVLF